LRGRALREKRPRFEQRAQLFGLRRVEARGEVFERRRVDVDASREIGHLRDHVQT
jgi:hypothetical protein